MNETPAERKSNIAATVISLAIKNDISEGFKLLIEFDPDPIKPDMANGLFAKPNSIPTKTLEQCLM